MSLALDALGERVQACIIRVRWTADETACDSFNCRGDCLRRAKGQPPFVSEIKTHAEQQLDQFVICEAAVQKLRGMTLDFGLEVEGINADAIVQFEGVEIVRPDAKVARCELVRCGAEIVFVTDQSCILNLDEARQLAHADSKLPRRFDVVGFQQYASFSTRGFAPMGAAADCDDEKLDTIIQTFRVWIAQSVGRLPPVFVTGKPLPSNLGAASS